MSSKVYTGSLAIANILLKRDGFVRASKFQSLVCKCAYLICSQTHVSEVCHLLMRMLSLHIHAFANICKTLCFRSSCCIRSLIFMLEFESACCQILLLNQHHPKPHLHLYRTFNIGEHFYSRSFLQVNMNDCTAPRPS